MALATLADVKLALEITDTKRDAAINDFLPQAAQAVLDETEREFEPIAEELRIVPVPLRSITGDGAVVQLAPFDLRVASLVRLHPEQTTPETLTDQTDYTLEPLISQLGVFERIRLSPFLSFQSDFAQRFGYARLEITATWGFAAVPENVNRAVVAAVVAWVSKPALEQAEQSQGVRDFNPASVGPRSLALPTASLNLLAPFMRTEIPQD